MDNNALIKFYEHCMEKGYEDMSDSKQSLKAKVIASDLGLDYKNIAKLYAEAKELYEKKIEREKRLAVNGEEILRFDDSYGVFRRPDGSLYTEHEGKRKEGISISVMKGSILSYTYHPSQTIFTGASSGGIMMGGTHQTEAYYDEKAVSSGKGDVVALMEGEQHFIETVTIPETVSKLFRRDDLFNRIEKSRSGNSYVIKCKTQFVDKKTAGQFLATKTTYESQMSALSTVLDMNRLPYEKCVDIANLLNRILRNEHPLSDEELYQKAISLSESETISDLEKAQTILKKISDYSDSNEKRKEVEIKIEERKQEEKEKAILAEEAKRAKLKKALPFIIVGCVLIIAAIIISVPYINKTQQYNNAVAMLEAGRYDEAKKVFDSLETFSDAEEYSLECTYQKAVAAYSKQEYKDAIKLFETITDYKDAKELVNECQAKLDEIKLAENQKIYDEGKKYLQQKDYENAIASFSKIKDFLDSDELLAKAKAAIKEEEERKVRIEQTIQAYNEYMQEASYKNGGDGIYNAYRVLKESNDFIAGKSEVLAFLEPIVAVAGTWVYDSGDPTIFSKNFDESHETITIGIAYWGDWNGQNDTLVLGEESNYKFWIFAEDGTWRMGQGWDYYKEFEAFTQTDFNYADWGAYINYKGHLFFERFANRGTTPISECEYRRK